MRLCCEVKERMYKDALVSGYCAWRKQVQKKGS